MNHAILLPLLVVIVGYGMVGPSPALAGLLALLALLPHIIRKRIVARPFIHIITPLLIFLGCAVTLATLLNDEVDSPTRIRAFWAAFAGASLLAAVARNYFARPIGGDTATLAIALLSLAALGDIRNRDQFLVLLALFLLTGFLARRYGDPGHAPLRALGWRHGVAMTLAIGVAGVTSYRLIESIPRMHSWVLANIGYGKTRTGFGRNMWLGSMRGLLLSDEVVMRLQGLPADYLRGVVYTRYIAGRWSEGLNNDDRYTPLPRALASSHDTTEIEYLDSNNNYYFLPRGVSAVAIHHGAARVNRWGVVSRAPMQPADRIQFRGGQGAVFPLAPPEAEDRAVPHDLLRVLQPIARAWVVDTDNAHDKLVAIEQHLANEFEYSLEFEAHAHEDPIVTFLTEQRRGHCEYFASAMVLLSRSIGIPARVVGGYRVWERNPLSGHFVIRERNAHAWVEAWAGQNGWDHYDPTPSEALARSNAGETQPLAALLDLGNRFGREFSRWLDQRTLQEFIAPPVMLLLLAFLLQLIRHLRERQAGRRKTVAIDEALPCLKQLSKILSQHGVRRRPSEPIEALMRRVHRSRLPGPLAKATSTALDDYIAFRFGGHGDELAIETEMKRLGAELTTDLRRSAGREPSPPSVRGS